MPPKLAAVPVEDTELPPILADYEPVQLAPRHDGWTAERQRIFLTMLAETGRVGRAVQAAGVSLRSAYRLRHHPAGAPFAKAWDQALYCAASKLINVAFERAIVGGVRQVWRNNHLIAEVRDPSDRMLIHLLDHLAPHFFSKAPLQDRQNLAAPAEAGFVEQLASLQDGPVAADPLGPQDSAQEPPRPHWQIPEAGDDPESFEDYPHI